MAPNPFLLAADDSPELLQLLREKPLLASSQDEHGYSLVHAAASYNHLALLRALVLEFNVDVNIKDEDNETALFVVETVEAAKVLVEELAVDVNHLNSEGFTAKDKIYAERDFAAVASYLGHGEGPSSRHETTTSSGPVADDLRPPPEGMKLTVGTMDLQSELPSESDPEFRRRIEELASRDDFDSDTGQAELKKLVEDVLAGQEIGDERNVKTKQS